MRKRAEICNDCKYGGYGVADQKCSIGKDNTNPDCKFFEAVDDYRDLETLKRMRQEVN